MGTRFCAYGEKQEMPTIHYPLSSLSKEVHSAIHLSSSLRDKLDEMLLIGDLRSFIYTLLFSPSENIHLG